MKSLKLAVVAISLIGIFGVGNAMAAGTATQNILVNATVVSSCSIDSFTDINFGVIDPFTDSTAKVPLSLGSITLKCTNGSSVTFDAPAADVTALTNTTDSYVISYTPVVPSAGPYDPKIGGTKYDITATLNSDLEIDGATPGTYLGNFNVVITY